MFLFFLVVFFINNLLVLAEKILAFRAPIGDVLLLLLYALPSVVALSVPFAGLVGALMAVGRLSSDDEILVMLSSGVSLKKVFEPFFFLSLVFAILSFAANDVLLPIGTVNFLKLQQRLILSTPAFVLQPYAAKEIEGQGITIVNGAVEGNRIRDVLIYDVADLAKRRVISATSAELVENRDQRGVITLVLEDAFTIMSDPSSPESFEYSSAGKMEYNIVSAKIAEGLSITPTQMSSVDVFKVIKEKRLALEARSASRMEAAERARVNLSVAYQATSANIMRNRMASADAAPQLARIRDEYRAQRDQDVSDRSLTIYELEYHKKFSIPFGAFFFCFLAFPIGLFAKRSGKAIGFGLGLLISIVYWAGIYLGITLVHRTNIVPMIAMWLPNAVVFVAGVAMFVGRRVRGSV
jgi:lipopolysaccharide export system permease protein